jgi:hypothetical protein
MWRRVSWLREPSRQRALLRALSDLCQVEWALRTTPIQAICSDWDLTLLDEVVDPTVVPEPSAESPLSAVDTWALRAVARRWPLGGSCLRYTLAVGLRLARRSAVPAQLVLATRKSQGGVEAHAWLRHAGTHYELPARPADSKFTPLQRAGS